MALLPSQVEGGAAFLGLAVNIATTGRKREGWGGEGKEKREDMGGEEGREGMGGEEGREGMGGEGMKGKGRKGREEGRESEIAQRDITCTTRYRISPVLTIRPL